MFDKYNYKEMVVRFLLFVLVIKNFNGILKKNCDWKN